MASKSLNELCEQLEEYARNAQVPPGLYQILRNIQEAAKNSAAPPVKCEHVPYKWVLPRTHKISCSLCGCPGLATVTGQEFTWDDDGTPTGER